MREKLALYCLKCAGQVMLLPQYLLRQFYSKNESFLLQKKQVHLIDWERCIEILSMGSRLTKIFITLIYLPPFPLKSTENINTVQFLDPNYCDLNSFKNGLELEVFFFPEMKRMSIPQEKRKGQLIFHNPCLDAAHSPASTDKRGCLNKRDGKRRGWRAYSIGKNTAN